VSGNTHIPLVYGNGTEAFPDGSDSKISAAGNVGFVTFIYAFPDGNMFSGSMSLQRVKRIVYKNFRNSTEP